MERYIVVERNGNEAEVWRRCNASSGCECGQVFHTLMATGTLPHARRIVDALNEGEEKPEVEAR